LPSTTSGLQPHTERSSQPGSELPSVEADVYVWRYMHSYWCMPKKKKKKEAWWQRRL